MKLIVGLGNPGKDYSLTRHNVGFIVVDNYLGDIKWSKRDKELYFLTSIEGEKVCFLKPQTFMNLSGTAVLDIVNYYDISMDDILVIQDDIDLPVGNFKIKANSSSGGHNGIKNIIDNLKSDAFARLKIGIGSSLDIPMVDYVLGRLSKNEINNLKSDLYKDIINSFILNGVSKTMQVYNEKGHQ